MLRLKITDGWVTAIGTMVAAIVGVIGLLARCDKDDNVVNHTPDPIKVESSYSEPEILKIPASDTALQPSTANPVSSSDR